jgi:hypothetical protein
LKQQIYTVIISTFSRFYQLYLGVQNINLCFSNFKRTLNIHFLRMKYRSVAFVRPILWISNKMWFRRKALILCTCDWLSLTLYEQILNYITNRSFLIRTFILKSLMIRIAKIYSDTNGNSHRGRSVLCIIMSFLSQILFKSCLRCVSFLKGNTIIIIGVMIYIKGMFGWHISFICNKSI